MSDLKKRVLFDYKDLKSRKVVKKVIGVAKMVTELSGNMEKKG